MKRIFQVLARVAMFVAVALCCSSLVSCKDEDEPKITSINIKEGTSLTLNVGNTANLHLTYEPSDLPAPTVVWDSSNTDVASVDSSTGLVTALKEGTAKIYAATNDGLMATCNLTVKHIPASSIAVDTTEVSIIIGDSYTLKATIIPDDATNKELIWTSSDNKVATVADGVITSVALGECTITVQDGNKEASATCKVTVLPISVTEIALSQTELSILIGSEATITATVKPDNATSKSLTWLSSNKDVAVVNDGVISAVGVGSCTISVTDEFNEVFSKCVVTVLPIMMESITLDVTEKTIEAGREFYLYATIAPENTTDKTLKWSSSNKKIATASSNGKVTAIKVGECIITVTDASGKVKAECAVTVKPVSVTGIEMTSYDTQKILLGGSKDLSGLYEILPSDAANKNVTWSSSDNEIVSINEKGVATANAIGYATITVKTEDGGYTDQINVRVVEITGLIDIDVSTQGGAIINGYLQAGHKFIFGFTNNSPKAVYLEEIEVTTESTSFTTGVTAGLTAQPGEYVGQYSFTVGYAVYNPVLEFKFIIDEERYSIKKQFIYSLWGGSKWVDVE